MARKEIRAAGTKTNTRDRIVRVAEWAWPYIEERCAALRTNDLLFPGVDRWEASDAHRAASALAELEDYQLRDQWHSYAVRAARAGTPTELIARQLGHANAVLVLKIYGRFMPSQQGPRQAGENRRRARSGRCKKHHFVHHASKQHEPTTRK